MHISDALSLSSLASVPCAAPATFQEFIKITSTVQYFMILRQSFERSSTACKAWVVLPSSLSLFEGGGEGSGAAFVSAKFAHSFN